MILNLREIINEVAPHLLDKYIELFENDSSESEDSDDSSESSDINLGLEEIEKMFNYYKSPEK